jgi:RHS repeat-associated protein
VIVAFNNLSSAGAGNGEASRVDDGVGFETYTYDSLNRATSKTRTIDGNSYLTQYSYNAINQLSVTTYPSNKQVRQNHDLRGRLSGIDKLSAGVFVSSYTSGVAYNTAGQVTGLTDGSGVVENYTYSNDRLQLTRQTATRSSDGSTLMDLNYSYAATTGASGVGTTAGNSGQLMAITSSPSSTINGQARNQAFTYDDLGRLTTASGWSVWQRRFAYDRWGNRTGVWDATSGGSQIQSVTLQQQPGAPAGVPSNRATMSTNSGTPSTQTYDAAGNLIGDGIHTYQYDGENRIAKVDAGTPNEADYFYDANNRRVKKTTSNNTYTTYCIWEGGRAIAEYSNAPAGTTGNSYYLADRLSNRMITDTNGGFKGTQDQLPFGEDAGTTGITEKHRFTNYERDAESATDYAVNRQYSGRAGRFGQADPIAGDTLNPQSHNRYAYALNDSVNLTDPEGLASCYIDWSPAPCSTALGLLQSGVGVLYNGSSIINIGGRVVPFAVGIDGTLITTMRVAINSAASGMKYVDENGEETDIIGVTEKTIYLSIPFSALPQSLRWQLDPRRAEFENGRTENDYGSQFLMAAPFAGLLRGAASSELGTVSRWGREGLKPGDWIMKGKVTPWNYMRSFKWQPGMGNEFAGYSTGRSYLVAADSIKWPTGWGVDGWWKGVFGQRIYSPR